MAFVNEEIKSSEEIAEFDSFGFTSPFSGKPLSARRWTIDRDRGWYFVNLGGGASEIPYSLLLAGKGKDQTIYLEGYEKSEGNYCKNGIEVWWHITSIRIPKLMSSRTSDLLSLIKDAFEAYGSLGNREVVKAVHVDFPSPTFI